VKPDVSCYLTTFCLIFLYHSWPLRSRVCGP
jgi:hypothetical protein